MLHPPSVVIIGAGRSGTNMLRDLLVQIPGLGTWPCDEINYIWRHGNISAPSDALTVSDARPEVVRYIRGRFRSIARAQDAEVVVEKTCANALRVPFVDAVLPEARFVHIVRDGRDVVASAMKRWTAELDPAYLAKKARYVPPTDLPYYALRYLSTRLHRLRSDEGRLGSWGPRYEGMQEVLGTHSLAEVCALQWRACVEAASADLGRLPEGRVFQLRYADFVRAPEENLRAVADFLERDPDALDLAALVEGVSPRSVGNWRRDLTPAQADAIAPIVDPVMQLVEGLPVRS